MNREYCNPEGYPDPTAFHAVNVVMKEEKRKKKLVFICSPYAGDIKRNVARARRYGRFAVCKKAIPIVPHLMYPQFLTEDIPTERALGLKMGLALLSRCHELWVFGDTISSGMETEIKKARLWRIPIRYFTIMCEEKEGELG